MSRPVEVTDAHMTRAYNETRKRDWPSLEVLREHYLHYAAIRGRAHALAAGLTSTPVTVATPAPSVPPPAPALTRRRSDPPAPNAPDLFSPRMAAAGEYAHPTDE